jgi:hypothetical protein
MKFSYATNYLKNDKITTNDSSKAIIMKKNILFT